MIDADDSGTRIFDVVVVGGGAVGAAATLEAARNGARVALLERDSLGASRGSSKGGARIYAPAAYPDEAYLELGLRAVERWRQVEDRTGERLLFVTGLLSVGRFAEGELQLLRAVGTTADLLDAADAERRFGVRAGDGRSVVHQPDAGVIKSDAALRALLRLGGDAGAELRSRAAVSRIEPGPVEVAVQTDRGVWRARAVIVAAGPWSGRLLADAGIDVPLAVSRQSVAYFRAPHGMPGLPAVIDYDRDEPFALPDLGGGLKAALHTRGPAADPDEGARADSASLGRLHAWVGASFPLLEAEPVGSETCLYTNTPDERFILERRGRVVIAAACNGQGFQLAPESGRRAAELALEPAEVSAR